MLFLHKIFIGGPIYYKVNVLKSKKVKFQFLNLYVEIFIFKAK